MKLRQKISSLDKVEKEVNKKQETIKEEMKDK
jgi:hypothetical protein